MCLVYILHTDNCTDGELRSVGFDDSDRPQLEICYRGLWGAACENPDTGIRGAELVVICRKILFQRGEKNLSIYLYACLLSYIASTWYDTDGEVWNDTQSQICTCPIDFENKCEGIIMTVLWIINYS